MKYEAFALLLLTELLLLLGEVYSLHVAVTPTPSHVDSLLSLCFVSLSSLVRNNRYFLFIERLHLLSLCKQRYNRTSLFIKIHFKKTKRKK